MTSQLAPKIEECTSIGPVAASYCHLCVGSSLEVFPVAGLPPATLRTGGGLAVITLGPTPFDALAVVRMDGDVVADLEAVIEAP